ncbi:hypothetical protein RclHR1_03190003 [Rhizophagus clarus]|uniref:Uncharacterized protein n=1 Tax=Rhizophagus clarus TaxID=94130 RepID=A0A2Z6RNY2_9GLOM|nr:hypothetical protein RclHR1_03190003 [Rhizophagus clarus]
MYGLVPFSNDFYSPPSFLTYTPYYDYSFLYSSVKLAHARQLKRCSRHIFSFDSVTPSQWDNFSAHIDNLCNISPTTFASWHVNRMCEYLHANIIAGANAVLPARVWFNIKGSRDFVKKQIAGECNSFAATLRLARLSAKQVIYLYNSVLIPKLEYRMQVTHLSATDCYAATRAIRSLVKHKANFSRSLPNPILYLSHALGLINLSSHLIQ